MKKEKENIEKTQEKAEESETDLLKKELEEYKKKSEENLDKFLRAQAEFDNAKKRMQRDRQEFIKYANEQILLELLSILDDLERSVEARESKHQDPEAFLKGIEMILSHLYEMLKKHDVKPIEANGKIFDPNQHEALMQIESEEHPENTVIAELQKGYLLGDRVIRTSKVQVTKQPESQKEAGEQIDNKENNSKDDNKNQ